MQHLSFLYEFTLQQQTVRAAFIISVWIHPTTANSPCSTDHFSFLYEFTLQVTAQCGHVKLDPVLTLLHPLYVFSPGTNSFFGTLLSLGNWTGFSCVFLSWCLVRTERAIVWDTHGDTKMSIITWPHCTAREANNPAGSFYFPCESDWRSQLTFCSKITLSHSLTTQAGEICNAITSKNYKLAELGLTTRRHQGTRLGHHEWSTENISQIQDDSMVMTFIRCYDASFVITHICCHNRWGRYVDHSHAVMPAWEWHKRSLPSLPHPAKHSTLWASVTFASTLSVNEPLSWQQQQFAHSETSQVALAYTGTSIDTLHPPSLVRI
jgi:hypothetical protein